MLKAYFRRLLNCFLQTAPDKWENGEAVWDYEADYPMQEYFWNGEECSSKEEYEIPFCQCCLLAIYNCIKNVIIVTHMPVAVLIKVGFFYVLKASKPVYIICINHTLMVC